MFICSLLHIHIKIDNLNEPKKKVHALHSGASENGLGLCIPLLAVQCFSVQNEVAHIERARD